MPHTDQSIGEFSVIHDTNKDIMVQHPHTQEHTNVAMENTDIDILGRDSDAYHFISDDDDSGANINLEESDSKVEQTNPWKPSPDSLQWSGWSEEIDTKTLSKLKLIEALQLDCEEGFVEWLRSDSIPPYWTELYLSWIKPQQDEHSRIRPRGPSTCEVQKAIYKSEKGGQLKYSYRTVSKSDWLTIDHYAWFLVHPCQDNVNHQDGIFFRCQISESRVDYLLSYIASLLTSEHAASWYYTIGYNTKQDK